MPYKVRTRYILVFISIGIPLAIIVYLGIFRHTGQQLLNQRLSELHQQGYPTTLEDLDVTLDIPPGANNAGPLYIDAISRFTPCTINLSQFEQKLPILAHPLPPSDQKLIQEILADYNDILTLLHQAAPMEYSTYPIDLDSGLYSNQPPLVPVQQLILLLSLEAYKSAEQENPTAAYESIKAAINLIQFFDTPVIIHHMLMNLGQTHVVHNLQRVLNRTSLSEHQLTTLSESLHDWLPSNGLAQPLAADRCRMIALVSQQCSKRDAIHANSWDEFIIYLRSNLGFLSRDIIQYIDLSQKKIDIAHLPAHQQLEAAQTYAESVNELRNPFLELIVSRSSSFFKSNLKALSQVHLAYTAIAIERYKRAFGNHPNTLEDLVPLYITTVSLDPFTGNPMQYESSEQGYRLFYLDTNSSSDIERESQDLTFTVYRQ